MRNMIAAETRKLLPHKATWLLVWIYPIAILFVSMVSLFSRLSGGAGHDNPVSAAVWIGQTAAVWHIPSLSLFRYLIGAYIALVFAGEYGWNTWKLVVPHAARWKLLASKYITAAALLYFAWFVSALIAVAIALLRSVLAHEPIPSGVTAGGIVQGHFHILLLGIAPVLLTFVYASLATVLTRSTLASFIITIVAVTIDELFGKIVQALSGFGMGWLAVPYRALPGYHLDNFTSWADAGVGYQLKLMDGTVIAFSQGVSFAMVAGWIVGLGMLTFLAFQRQDIN